MQIVRIPEKCNKCMLCVRDCTPGVWRNIDNVPVPAQPVLCNLCGHCAAICPRDAIFHSGLEQNSMARIEKKLINPAVYQHIVKSRRSIRHYRDREVPRELIEKIIDLAGYSPTASNLQNVSYIVITDTILIRKTGEEIFSFGYNIFRKTTKGPGKILAAITGLDTLRYFQGMEYLNEQAKSGRDYILHGAPTLILVHAPRHERMVSDNCNIAATNIINYAHSLGLGTCLIGFLTIALRFSNRLRKRFGVPNQNRVYASLVMGFPAIAYTNAAPRKKPNISWM